MGLSILIDIFMNYLISFYKLYILLYIYCLHCMETKNSQKDSRTEILFITYHTTTTDSAQEQTKFLF
jgi:hypothetical protein